MRALYDYVLFVQRFFYRYYFIFLPYSSHWRRLLKFCFIVSVFQ